MAAIAARGNADISQIYERNQEATLYVGNLDSRVDEDILWEIFTQAGPVKNVHTPRDRVTGQHASYGFVEYQLESDAEYALKILNMIKLYGRPMRCNKAAQDKRTTEVGANLFVGNLDPDVDESILFDTFSSFGNILSTKVMRDLDTGEHRGFGFVAFDAFEHSDAALAAMNGQFLCNRPIHVSYAYKKDTKGERHGSTAERLIAANRPLVGAADGTSEQQKVMAQVMSTMINSMLSQSTPTVGTGALMGHSGGMPPMGYPAVPPMPMVTGIGNTTPLGMMPPPPPPRDLRPPQQPSAPSTDPPTSSAVEHPPPTHDASSYSDGLASGLAVIAPPSSLAPDAPQVTAQPSTATAVPQAANQNNMMPRIVAPPPTMFGAGGMRPLGMPMPPPGMPMPPFLMHHPGMMMPMPPPGMMPRPNIMYPTGMGGPTQLPPMPQPPTS